METVSKLSLTSAATVVRVCICGILKGLRGGGGGGGGRKGVKGCRSSTCFMLKFKIF